jgi:hypothetical protein
MRRWIPPILPLLLAAMSALPAAAEIRRDPVGVNVNMQGATSVFITFGGLSNQVPVEAAWCGDLVPAAPDIGQKCDPGSVFGLLPIRFDQSSQSASGSSFTDIMSIPPSVARRAYQAAARGSDPTFFYVRRFRHLGGGPDEYVFVTCRLSAGGARSPLALLDVRLRFDGDPTVLSVERGQTPPALAAEIAYNGTGQLKGRWEVVLPGDAPPQSRDLLTEATLPPEERPLQRRYTELQRFNVFLPPTGRVVLPGPDPRLLPTAVEGMHQLLLRVEASEEREGDSNLGAAGAGQGIVPAGGVAGFPLPVLRYYVGSVPAAGAFALVLPADGARVPPGQPLDFSWDQRASAVLYRIEYNDSADQQLFTAVVQQGIGTYRAPSWLRERAADGKLRWRVVALGPEGEDVAATVWRWLELVRTVP